MTLFIAALKCEANALIELFDLKKIENPHFRIYKNGKTVLIISGIGNINATIAVTYALVNFKITKAINIGICGSFDKNIKKGEIFEINKLIDYHANKVYHIPQKAGFTKVKTLYSFSSAQNQSTALLNSLADMESIGFYLGAKKFLEIGNITILKVVSDHISDKILECEEVTKLIKKHNDLYTKIAHKT